VWWDGICSLGFSNGRVFGLDIFSVERRHQIFHREEIMALIRATDLKVGDVVKGSDSPVKSLSFANGADGKDRQMIGGMGAETAYALRVSFEDGSEALVHPAKKVKLLANS
jgi:hypothetical protein